MPNKALNLISWSFWSSLAKTSGWLSLLQKMDTLGTSIYNKRGIKEEKVSLRYIYIQYVKRGSYDITKKWMKKAFQD